MVEDLAKPDAPEESQNRALALAAVAFSIPYPIKDALAKSLLSLPCRMALKYRLLASLVARGYVVSADLVIQGLTELLAEAKKESWRLDENRGELAGCLDILPFADRPAATLDGLALLEPNLRLPWSLRRLLRALNNAPDAAVEEVLFKLSRQNPEFLKEHDWIQAVVRKGTLTAGLGLLWIILDGKLSRRVDGWKLQKDMAALASAHPQLLSEITRNCPTARPSASWNASSARLVYLKV